QRLPGQLRHNDAGAACYQPSSPPFNASCRPSCRLTDSGLLQLNTPDESKLNQLPAIQFVVQRATAEVAFHSLADFRPGHQPAVNPLANAMHFFHPEIGHLRSGLGIGEDAECPEEAGNAGENSAGVEEAYQQIPVHGELEVLIQRSPDLVP